MAAKVSPPASPVTLVEYAAGRLRDEILSGELPTGTHINLDRTAQRLGMSPIPVREALRILEAERIVISIRQRGYTVSQVTVQDLDEIYRLRFLLEPLAVELAVPRLTDEQIAQLESDLLLLDDAFARNDWDAHRRYHRAFHFGIYTPCGSPHLLRFLEVLWVNSQRYQRITTRLKGELEQRAREHHLIFAACRAREVKQAAGLMHDHVRRALDVIRDALLADAGGLAETSMPAVAKGAIR